MGEGVARRHLHSTRRRCGRAWTPKRGGAWVERGWTPLPCALDPASHREKLEQRGEALRMLLRLVDRLTLFEMRDGQRVQVVIRVGARVGGRTGRDRSRAASRAARREGMSTALWSQEAAAGRRPSCPHSHFRAAASGCSGRTSWSSWLASQSALGGGRRSSRRHDTPTTSARRWAAWIMSVEPQAPLESSRKAQRVATGRPTPSLLTPDAIPSVRVRIGGTGTLGT